MRQRWPEKLWIVRHGQSAGNVARDAAQAAGLHVIDIALRDVDVPLSELGLEQARALGRWFAALPQGERPEILLASPYVRARQTAQAICEAGGIVAEARPATPGPSGSTVERTPGLIVDERLREREFGVFDRLTTAGIKDKYPDLAEHRALLGKFYHRAPGGESWADVILRLRSALDTISLHHADRRVLIVCHQVVVLCIRYILEEMDEAQILAIDKQGDVVNCGICEYDFEPDDAKSCVPKLLRYNFAAPLVEERAPVTSEPDAMGRGTMTEPERLDRRLLRCFPLPHLPEDGDKEDRGRLLVIAGSRELAGAALLAGLGGLRAGAGKLQIATVRSIAVQLAIAIPEARVIGCDESEEGCLAASATPSLLEDARDAHAIAIGSGLQHGRPLEQGLDALLGSGLDKPLVLDAAVLGCLASRSEALRAWRGGAAILPHTREMARLLEQDHAQIVADPLGAARQAASQFNVVALIKGEWSHIVDPSGRAFSFKGGGVGLATSGSGDVLAGIVGGLCARGADPLTAVLWGVYLHGEAGRQLSEHIGRIGFLARELLDRIPRLLED